MSFILDIEKKSSSKRVNLDDLGDDLDDPDKSDEDRSDVGSQAAEEDYDVDEEYDNDYAENYFDNGEGDDMDDLGGGGGGDEGGGKSFSCWARLGLDSLWLSLFRVGLWLKCIMCRYAQIIIVIFALFLFIYSESSSNAVVFPRST